MRVRFGPAGADASTGATEGMKMNPRVKVLKELVNSELYVIDDAAVADAVLLRSMARHTLPDVAFAAPRDRSPRSARFARIAARGRFA